MITEEMGTFGPCNNGPGKWFTDNDFEVDGIRYHRPDGVAPGVSCGRLMFETIPDTSTGGTVARFGQPIDEGMWLRHGLIIEAE